MGNCIRKGKPAASEWEWGGEDWGFLAPQPIFSGDLKVAKIHARERISLGLGDNKMGVNSFLSSSSSSPSATTKLKIRVTKKQLKELLALAKLRQLSSGAGASDRKPRRPALQTIPEAD
ncbi:hypothetical protein NMG60_11002223 [Bertholletia excelsa]